MRGAPLLRLLGALACLACLPHPAAAQTEWFVRGHVAWIDYERDSSTSSGLGRNTLHLASGPGFEISVEAVPWPYVGVALGIGRLDLEARSESFTRFGPRPEDERPFLRADGSFIVKPLTLGVLVHPPIAGERADLRLGGHLAYIQYDEAPFTQPREDELGLIGSLGLDVPVARRLGISAEVRYLHAFHEGVERDHYGEFDTWVAQLGVSYRLPIR